MYTKMDIWAICQPRGWSLIFMLIHLSFFFYCAAKFLHFKAHVLLVKYVKYVSLCRAVECLITDTVIAQWTVACLNPSSSVSSYSHLNFLYFLPLSLFLISSFPPSFPLTSPLLFCSLAVSGERLSICVWAGLCLCKVECVRLFRGCIFSMWPWWGPNRCRLNGYEWSCE